MLNFLLPTLPTEACKSATKYLLIFLATVNLDNGGVIEKLFMLNNLFVKLFIAKVFEKLLACAI